MTTEKHDPWALLREARDFMRQAAISRGPCPDCTECDHRDAVIAKADAALAEHEAVPPEEVRWMQSGFVEEEQIADVKGGTLIVCDRGPDDWAWMLIRRGRATTETEAKSAAIAAARGLR